MVHLAHKVSECGHTVSRRVFTDGVFGLSRDEGHNATKRRGSNGGSRSIFPGKALEFLTGR